MDTEALIGPEVKILVTYPLINDHIFTNEPTTVDKVPTAGFNIPIRSRLYLYEDSPYNQSLNQPLFVGVGYFFIFVFNDITVIF